MALGALWARATASEEGSSIELAAAAALARLLRCAAVRALLPPVGPAAGGLPSLPGTMRYLARLLSRPAAASGAVGAAAEDALLAALRSEAVDGDGAASHTAAFVDADGLLAALCAGAGAAAEAEPAQRCVRVLTAIARSPSGATALLADTRGAAAGFTCRMEQLAALAAAELQRAAADVPAGERAAALSAGLCAALGCARRCMAPDGVSRCDAALRNVGLLAALQRAAESDARRTSAACLLALLLPPLADPPSVRRCSSPPSPRHPLLDEAPAALAAAAAAVVAVLRLAELRACDASAPAADDAAERAGEVLYPRLPVRLLWQPALAAAEALASAGNAAAALREAGIEGCACFLTPRAPRVSHLRVRLPSPARPQRAAGARSAAQRGGAKPDGRGGPGRLCAGGRVARPPRASRVLAVSACERARRCSLPPQAHAGGRQRADAERDGRGGRGCAAAAGGSRGRRVGGAAVGSSCICSTGLCIHTPVLLFRVGGLLRQSVSAPCARGWARAVGGGTARAMASSTPRKRVLEGHANTVSALAALPDGRLASGSWDGTVRVWNPLKGAPPGHAGEGGPCAALLGGRERTGLSGGNGAESGSLRAHARANLATRPARARRCPVVARQARVRRCSKATRTT